MGTQAAVRIARQHLFKVLAASLIPLSGALSVQTAHAGPASLKACQVRSGCSIFVPQVTECESIVAWRGKCERGLVQGTGALHFAHGYALIGRHAEGRAIGQVVWHENGIPKGIGEYETQLLSIGPDGVEQRDVVNCHWDFDRNKVVSELPDDKRCEAAAKSLGELAFSPEVWREYAKQANKEQVAPGGVVQSMGRRLP